MKINFNNFSFKGYDATKLKRIYISENHCNCALNEINDALKQENIELCPKYSTTRWLQDNQVFLHQNNTLKFLSPPARWNEHTERMYGINPDIDAFVQDIKNTEGQKIETITDKGYVTGGNCFIGKLKNGEKWMLLGEYAVAGSKQQKEEKLNKIAQLYDTKRENIFILPQEEYHLDMFIRPIGYPYILVNDVNLAKENVKKLDKNSPLYDDFYSNFLFYSLRKNTKQTEQTIKILKNAGFKPIRIAGCYGRGVNFINAIVNKHENGTISYITNSTKPNSNTTTTYSTLEDIFKKDLKAKVKNLDKVYFIKGESINSPQTNFMFDNLMYNSGGIHCLTLERPDFDLSE